MSFIMNKNIAMVCEKKIFCGSAKNSLGPAVGIHCFLVFMLCEKNSLSASVKIFCLYEGFVGKLNWSSLIIFLIFT